MYLSPLIPPSPLVEAIIALVWCRAIRSLLASWCCPTVYFQQGSQNILLKKKLDSSYPSSSQNLANFSCTPSKVRGLAFAPEAWHQLGVLSSPLCLTTDSSPLSRRYSHAGPLSVSQNISEHTLSHQGLCTHYSLRPEGRFPVQGMLLLFCQNQLSLSWRPFLIELFKTAVLLPQPCHSLTCFIYLRSMYHQLTHYIFTCSSSVSSH